jgi:hypothetical protein
MKSHTTLEDLEALMAQACIALSDAASDVEVLPAEVGASFKRKVADALVRTWDARDILHSFRPDLKPVYLVEIGRNPEAHQKYCEAILMFHQLAQQGNTSKGFAVLREFASTCSSPYFAGLAERTIANHGGAI